MANDICILIGNGLNRASTATDYPSWESIVSEIANVFFANRFSGGLESIRCESFLQAGLNIYAEGECQKKIDAILRKLSDVELKRSSPLVRLAQAGHKCFLTTNYDYLLENAISNRLISLGSDYKKETKGKNETYGSVRRRTVLNDISVFHIHGELDYPKSVCLGITHYARNLERVINSIRANDCDEESYRINPSIFDGDSPLQSWAQFFFTKDIFIIGQGMADSEIDLWWLIAYRSALLNSAESVKVSNKIVYLCAHEKKKPPVCDALKSLGVEVRPRKVEDGDWAAAYNALIDSIPLPLS